MSTKISPPMVAGEEVQNLVVSGNWAALTVGTWYSQPDLYVVHVPEPTTLWLSVGGMLLGVRRQRARSS